MADDRARASLMEHSVRAGDQPAAGRQPRVLQETVGAAGAIIYALRQGTLDNLDACRRIGMLGGQVRGEEDLAARMGHTPRSFAVYNLLLGGADGPEGGGGRADAAPDGGEIDEEASALAEQVDAALDGHTGLIDWENNPEVHREMRSDAKRVLREAGRGYTQEELDKLSHQIVEIAKRRTREQGR